ncbi:DUF2752 domain-containing protein [Flavobacterium sp. JP2137]|uniref:DUF2752 domain-containing protein n=1 Tax=Flavobacterium sp. JP2137 TaxID=3414510 RepID=UPI003D2FC185
MEKLLLPCLNKSIFGIDCLGCGTQRAMVLITQGEFVKAFYMFPAIYTLLLFFGAVFLNFIDLSRNYHKIIIGLALINALIMATSYILKIFYLT